MMNINNLDLRGIGLNRIPLYKEKFGDSIPGSGEPPEPPGPSVQEILHIENIHGNIVDTASGIGLASKNVITSDPAGRLLFNTDANSYILTDSNPLFDVNSVDFNYYITINQQVRIGRYYVITGFNSSVDTPGGFQVGLVGKSTHGLTVMLHQGNIGTEAGNLFAVNLNQEYKIKVEKRNESFKVYIDDVPLWNVDLNNTVKRGGNSILIGSNTNSVSDVAAFYGYISDIRYEVVNQVSK